MTTSVSYAYGDKVIYMRIGPGIVGFEEIPATYVAPRGAKTPYGWKRHKIQIDSTGAFRYVSIAAIRTAQSERG